MQRAAHQNGEEITGDQTVFPVQEETGQTQGREGTEVVEEGLQRRKNVAAAALKELQTAVDERGDQTDAQPVPVADQDHKEHGAEGDGAAPGEAEELHVGEGEGEGERDGTEDHLPRGENTGIGGAGAAVRLRAAGAKEGNEDQKQCHDRDHGDGAGSGQGVVFSVFEVLEKQGHKKTSIH